ncbi:MAG: Asp23/Gls24 family envelope stress response protein [Clostridiales bacterium]|nr:Asp23/Gls24 family envelope stress response protein [Clostridiales bacterium]
MEARTKNALGEITISNEVIATLAGISAIESYGIVGMAAKRAVDGLTELLGWDNLTRGVRVSTKGNSVIIDLFIIVKYGVSINTVAKNVIERAKYSVENLTGMKVERVNITVHGVRV